MTTLSDRIRTREQTERVLLKEVGFSAALLGIQYLESHILEHPAQITRKTVNVLLHLIRSCRHEKKKQAYFLYKQAASALITLSKNPTHPLAGSLISEMQDLLFTGNRKKHRAVSEALGSLPLRLKDPPTLPCKPSTPFKISFERFAGHCPDIQKKTGRWLGRTLIYKGKNRTRYCLKFLHPGQPADELSSESDWLAYLNAQDFGPEFTFNIPKPLTICNHLIFQFTELPCRPTDGKKICNRSIAICYVADETYFHYANEPDHFNFWDKDLLEVYGKNAWLLGKLASKGIIHTALIPLFHNRVQQSRREDNGVYNWRQGGRLDQWLVSSQYPNFAISGLRDFEHLMAVNTSNRLHHYIGEHILAFILVAGSLFRNKAPGRNGPDQDGTPGDFTALFDRELFLKLIKRIICQYYYGLTGFHFHNPDRLVTKELLDALIHAMGVDQHMDEILRVNDQETMNDGMFADFLRSRGVDRKTIDRSIRAKEDIILRTGPHLGAFSGPISVPELIRFLFCLSSLCVSDCYLRENGLKADRT